MLKLVWVYHTLVSMTGRLSNIKYHCPISIYMYPKATLQTRLNTATVVCYVQYMWWIAWLKVIRLIRQKLEQLLHHRARTHQPNCNTKNVTTAADLHPNLSVWFRSPITRNWLEHVHCMLNFGKAKTRCCALYRHWAKVPVAVSSPGDSACCCIVTGDSFYCSLVVI